MQARIIFELDNAAFEDNPATELAKILRRLAERIEAGELAPIPLRDTNGNLVGFFQIEDNP